MNTLSLFYTDISDQAILSTLCRELGWSHLRLDSSVTDKESLTVQTEGAREASDPAASDQFRGVTELIGSGIKPGVLS